MRQAVILPFPDAGRYEFIPSTAEGDEPQRFDGLIWRLVASDPSQSGERLELPVGQQLVFGATWDQRSADGESVEPGRYYIMTVGPIYSVRQQG